MNQFNLWQKILLINSLLMIFIGLFIAFLNQSFIFNYIFNNQINPVFWVDNNIPIATAQFQSWIYGLLGATLSGWGIFLAYIAQFPFKEKQKWSWSCITAGITLWFIADTSISIYFNVFFNVVFNTILFLIIFIPLIFTKKYFKGNIETNGLPSEMQNMWNL